MSDLRMFQLGLEIVKTVLNVLEASLGESNFKVSRKNSTKKED